MISNSLGQSLHDRSTRGEPLSEKEEALLERWYNEQDAIESKLLSTIKADNQDEKTSAKLQSQIEATLTQLISLTQRIQDITSENARLHQEINDLRHQLTHVSIRQQVI